MILPDSKSLLLAGGAVASAILAVAAVSEAPKLVSYVIFTDKIRNPIRLLQVSDLHSSPYGKEQAALIALTDAATPDAILLTGDIADNRIPNHNAFAYTKDVGRRYPCYYVTGNHEFYTDRIDEIRRTFASHGLHLLEGTTEHLEVRGESLSISGIITAAATSDLSIVSNTAQTTFQNISLVVRKIT